MKTPVARCILRDLGDWEVLQVQMVDQDSPVWERLQKTLVVEFAEQQSGMETKSSENTNSRHLVYDRVRSLRTKKKNRACNRSFLGQHDHPSPGGPEPHGFAGCGAPRERIRVVTRRCIPTAKQESSVRYVPFLVRWRFLEAIVNRRRVEYYMPRVRGIRIFVEKPTAKQPIISQMQAEAGLSREGTMLGAINEWRTWFVVDKTDSSTS